MPGRPPKSTAAKVIKSKNRVQGLKQRNGAQQSRRRAVHPKWKPVPQSTKSFVLNLFDSGIRLLMHKVPEHLDEEIHSALMDARNQVAVSLETLRVPPSKLDYNHLAAALPNLLESKEQLKQKIAAITKTLDAQEKELQQMETEKTRLQDFGKLPGQHHPLLVEPMENELHLNYNTVK